MIDGGGSHSSESTSDKDQIAKIEQRVQRAYVEREKRLLLAREKGPAWYITRKMLWLFPSLALVLALVLSALGAVTRVGFQWLEATNVSWPLGVFVLAVAGGLVLSCIVAVYLWRRARTVFFPLLPLDSQLPEGHHGSPAEYLPK